MKQSLIALFIGLGLTAQASATIYQCGDNTFQQTPCEQGAGKEIEVNAPKASSTPNTAKQNRGDLVRQSVLRTAVEKGKIMVGMTEQQVISAWGKPDRKNNSLYSSQWVYDRGRGQAQYIYFEDGLVSNWN